MGVFFASWKLWEEMTFVLACAIVVVFFIGLFKLWQTSRQLRRQEQLDEEKRARRVDLRRVVPGPKGGSGRGGNASRRKHRHGSDIPFGVRAIQSGVQVDGIWILRPATPSRPNTSEAALPQSNDGRSPWLLSEQTKQQQRQQQQQQQEETAAYVPMTMVPDVDRGGLVLDASSPTKSMPLSKISGDGTFPVSDTAHPPLGHDPRGGNGSSSTGDRRAGTNALSEDALYQLEGVHWPTPSFVDTYIPGSQRSDPRPGPSPSPGLHSRRDNDNRCHSPGLAHAPVLVADRNSRTKSQESSSNSSSSKDTGLKQQRPRVVNTGFEVLPVGTFGRAAVPSPPNTRGPLSIRQRDSHVSPPRNKLRRTLGTASLANTKHT